jgi:hypothetical protein
MSLATSLLVCAALTATPARSPKLELGQARFAQGDIDGALKVLDAAAVESQDPAVLEKVQLLRGQCFAARQDFARAEEAFEHALESGPLATLDPARVDPAVVRLLDAVRSKLVGTLVVYARPEGAAVTLNVDGKKQEAPASVSLPIGRHTVEWWAGGTKGSSEVLVYPRRETEVVVALAGSDRGPPVERVPTVFGDFRGALEVASDARLPWQGGVDFGGGFESGPVRLSLLARLFPYFGVSPRAAFVVPVWDRLSVFLELEVPVWFRGGGIAVGMGGGAGVEYHLWKSFGVFGQVGGEHLFLNPGRIDDTHFVASGGVRLRPP